MFRAISLTLMIIILVAAVPTFAQAGDDPEPSSIAIWDANVVDVLDMETGEILFSLELDEDIEILGALLDTEQTRLLIWTETEAYLWVLQAEPQIRLTSNTEPEEGTLITFTPVEPIAYALWSEDDTQIMTVTASQTRMIWDVETGKMLREIAPTRRK
jgi:hypothetical protein